MKENDDIRDSLNYGGGGLEAFRQWSEILRSNKKAEDKRIYSEMEHELASIMWDVTNRRGYHA